MKLNKRQLRRMIMEVMLKEENNPGGTIKFTPDSDNIFIETNPSAEKYEDRYTGYVEL